MTHRPLTSAVFATIALSLVACGAVTDAELPPIDETPVDETPIDETPIDETPVDEEPVDEEPIDEVAVAPFDNDSLQQPAQDVFLSITGTRSLLHTDEISAPSGDGDDWVAFRLPPSSNPQQRIYLTLDCALTGAPDAIVRATIWTDGAATTRSVACNAGEAPITVDNRLPHAVRVHVVSAPTAVHVDYTLTVRGF